MSLAKFVRHYAGEALATASALATVLEGLALSPKQHEVVQVTIDKLREAAENIVGSSTKDTVVKIEKKDIEAAVKAVVGPMVTKAVADALAAKEKSNG